MPQQRIPEEMVGLIASPAFNEKFFDQVNQFIGIDHCTVFTRENGRTRTLVAHAATTPDTNITQQLASAYVHKGFQRDPIWTADVTTTQHPLLRRPQDFSDSSYRAEYYNRPAIRSELAVISQIDETRIYFSFYRKQRNPDFAQHEVDWLRTYGGLLSRIVHKHAMLSADHHIAEPQQAQPANNRELHDRVLNAILLDRCQLTPREAEVCAGIVLGHTVLGLSMNLGISVNTVATHRKRAYAKLRISSQNELFARYFAVANVN